MNKDKNKNKGFTLIEILVVVLIICILAAIAIPQYQKVVDKSRFSQLRQVTHAIANAQNAYILANGQPITSFNDLDISFSNWKVSGTGATFPWGYCNLTSSGTPHCYLKKPKVDYYVLNTYIRCAAETSSKRAMDLCRQELPGAKGTYFASDFCPYPCTVFDKR